MTTNMDDGGEQVTWGDQLSDTQHTVSESADKIVVKTKLVRGTGTRDQEKLDVKVKGSDPGDVVQRLNDTLVRLEMTAEYARDLQPGENDG